MSEAPQQQMTDEGERFMRRALALARRGSGYTRPNPLVGAVLVKEGRIVGQGWHQRSGGPHAEIHALKAAGAEAEGATLYATLEPCNHFGKTPPCTEAIIAAGVARVEVALRDMNPHVKGQGVERLREAGTEVRVGLLAEKARELNVAWTHWVTTGRPFVLAKLSLSIDGRTSFADGSAKWLSSPISRVQLQRLRRYVDAVIVGSDIVLNDDPLLTNRSGSGAQPLRVIVDPRLETSPEAAVYCPLGPDQLGPSPAVIVATTSKAGFQVRRELELKGAEVIVLENVAGEVDLEELIVLLGKRGIQSVVCEGGVKTTGNLLRLGLCQRLLVYRVPVVIGPQGGELFDENGVEKTLPQLQLRETRKLGLDAYAVYDVMTMGQQQAEKIA